MNIRTMLAGDKESVLQILIRTGMFTAAEINVAEELIDHFLLRPEQGDYFIEVVESDTGNVAGYVTWGPTPLAEGTFDLYWIAISPDVQGQGYGKMLMRSVEQKIEEEQGRLLIIETSSQPKYESTRQFYLKQQYQEVARIAGFYAENDDRIIYAKYFSRKDYR